MPFKYCQHVRENGAFCGSAAVRGRSYCYFHLRTRARRLAVAKANSQQKPGRLELPPLDDMHAVQVALMQVTDALSHETIDPRRAGLMLYALRQAALNLRHRASWVMSSPFKMRADEDDAVISYPGLEAEFGLPNRIDLDASPDELFPAPVRLEPSPTPMEADAGQQGSAPRKPSKSVRQEKFSPGELAKKA